MTQGAGINVLLKRAPAALSKPPSHVPVRGVRGKARQLQGAHANRDSLGGAPRCAGSHNLCTQDEPIDRTEERRGFWRELSSSALTGRSRPHLWVAFGRTPRRNRSMPLCTRFGSGDCGDGTRRCFSSRRKSYKFCESLGSPPSLKRSPKGKTRKRSVPHLDAFRASDRFELLLRPRAA